jgi:hypothetical protein
MAISAHEPCIADRGVEMASVFKHLDGLARAPKIMCRATQAWQRPVHIYGKVSRLGLHTMDQN